MKWLKLLLIFLIFSPLILEAQTKLIDENLSDWSVDDIIVQDPSGDAQGVDFGQWYISSDAQQVYMQIEMGQEIELQASQGLRLYIDADNNSNTGLNSATQRGADIVYDFGNRSGYYFDGNNFYDIFHSDFDLVSLPTVSSDVFEISFSRTINYFNGSLTLAPSIRLAMWNSMAPAGDRIPDAGWATYSLQSSNYEVVPFNLDRAAYTDVRFMSYNTQSDALFDNSKTTAYRNIFQATQPDIICFQEIYDHTAQEVALRIEELHPIGSQIWHTDRVGPDIIVASRFPIVNSVQSDGNGIFEINVDGTYIIVINMHLPCCNNETERQNEVDRLMAFIRNAKAMSTFIPFEENTPIFIMGDMNFVGLRQQRTTLATGDILQNNLFGPDFSPDWDGTAFDMATPYMTGSTNAATWYNANGSYSAGRLDYFLYSGSVVDELNSYVLNTALLPASILNQYNLSAQDTELASDHFPIVVDVSIDAISSTNNTVQQDHTLYPNPVQDILSINSPTTPIRTTIIHADGRTAIMPMKEDGHVIQLNVAQLPTGVYSLRLDFADNLFSVYRFIKY